MKIKFRRRNFVPWKTYYGICIYSLFITWHPYGENKGFLKEKIFNRTIIRFGRLVFTKHKKKYWYDFATFREDY